MAMKKSAKSATSTQFRPNPQGSPQEEKAKSDLIFVSGIKHLASQLHYDFRLEI